MFGTFSPAIRSICAKALCGFPSRNKYFQCIFSALCRRTMYKQCNSSRSYKSPRLLHRLLSNPLMRILTKRCGPQQIHTIRRNLSDRKALKRELQEKYARKFTSKAENKSKDDAEDIERSSPRSSFSTPIQTIDRTIQRSRSFITTIVPGMVLDQPSESRSSQEARQKVIDSLVLQEGFSKNNLCDRKTEGFGKHYA